MPCADECGGKAPHATTQQVGGHAPGSPASNSCIWAAAAVWAHQHVNGRMYRPPQCTCQITHDLAETLWQMWPVSELSGAQGAWAMSAYIIQALPLQRSSCSAECSERMGGDPANGTLYSSMLTGLRADVP